MYLQVPKHARRDLKGAPRGPRIQPSPYGGRRSRTASRRLTRQGANGLGLSKANNGAKSLKGQALPSTPGLLGQGAAATWRGSKAVEASNSPDGRAISLTDSWFSAAPLQASQTLVAWFLLHPRVAVEMSRHGTTLSWAFFSTCSGSAGSELPALLGRGT